MAKDVIKKWHEYRKAKKEMLKAESDIVVTELLPVSNVCKKNIVVTGNLNSTTTPVVCKHFQADDFCDNPNCPMFGENARYIFALRKYKEARSEFISSLVFWRSK